MLMKQLGLVFSGGGGKGAYEIGVWKALKEFGIDKNVKAVSGTSVGGLNGALFVAGDYEAAEKLWLDIAPSKVLTLTKEKVAKALASVALGAVIPGVLPKALLTLNSTLGGKGVFSQEGLAALIKDSHACDVIDNQSLPFQICALTAKGAELIYPTLNDLSSEEKEKWLLATSAIPVVFDSIEINGSNYVDGGVLPSPYSDNTPYKPLIEQHGCTHIINIFLDCKPDTIDASQKYPNVKFWNIVPTQAFDGFIDSLNFTRDNAANLIELGYQDTAKILKQFKAFIDDEERYLQAVFEFGESHHQFTDQIALNKTLRGEGETLTEITTEKSTEIADLSYDDVLAQLSINIKEQERKLIDSNIDEMLEDMTQTSDELLEQAFTSITTLASTEGRINSQLEQGHISRFVGAITGSDAKLQAGINWDLNRAIYANQQLIQKLNHKQMLTMEAMVSLSNKTNYLMSHVNVLYSSVKKLEQSFHTSLQLMKQGLESLAESCIQQFKVMDARIENLERAQLVDNWYHQAKAKKALTADSAANELIIELTTSFYNQMGRSWDNNELLRYINALDEFGIEQQTVCASQLLEANSVQLFIDTIDCSAVLPVKPVKQCFHPILKGLQIVSETSTNNVEQQLEQQLGLCLIQDRTGLELGLELLHSLRCNDRRAPKLTTTQTALQLEVPYHGKQAELLNVVDTLKEINDSLLNNTNVTKSLEYLNVQVSEFKVVVPIIGKYSSGKSSLLNTYLGANYLKYDITAETAFATELCYGEEEYILLNFIDGSTPVKKSLTELHSIQTDENLYFVQLFINNSKLKNRNNLVLVDMPGFDSLNNSHHKAIACYLARGDVFINLMPSNIPFDASVIERLQEIRFDYDKNIFNFISKAGRESPSKLQLLKQELELTLSNSLDQPTKVGFIESLDKNTRITDFENALDTALSGFDELLNQRYSGEIIKVNETMLNSVMSLKTYAQSDQAQLKAKISAAEDDFIQIKKRISNSLNEMEHRLCSLGKEQLIAQAQSTLQSSISSLTTAAKNNQISTKINELLRPVLQKGIEQLVKAELERLETKLDEITQHEFSDVQVNIQIPAQEKEAFSISYAAIGAGIAAVILGPVSALVAGVLGGLFGKKDNAQEREQQIEQQVRNQVIPQAVSMVVEQTNTLLNSQVQTIKKAVMTSFEQEQQNHQQLVAELQKQRQADQEAFNLQQDNFEQVLVQLKAQLNILRPQSELLAEKNSRAPVHKEIPQKEFS
ncbi:MAG: putative acylesterase/phospholipase RssA [Cocleimonas sp.]|jgi:predicted acylesterase/phospholipase RssA